MREKYGVETSEASIRRAVARHEVLQDAYESRNIRRELEQRTEAPGAKYLENGMVEVTLPPTDENEKISHLTIEEVMKRHKLDPEEWEAERALPNVWEANAGEGTKIQLYQFKIWFKKRVPLRLIYPATVGPAIRPPVSADYGDTDLWVITTDQQTPFRLENLHTLFLRWLRFNKPDKGIIGGDLLDNGYISRHRDDPAWHRTVQECIQQAFDTIHDYRQASLDTSWTLIKGNHDDRIRNEMLERNERLYGVTAAQWPGEESEEWVYSMNHLLHLKKLGVEYHEPLGTYEFEQVPITETLAVRHGHKTVKHRAALATSEELGHSIVMGHTHRQSIARKTVWNSIKKEYAVTTAIEAGCMCEIVGGLGYANSGCPDWQPGFATIEVFKDGGFSFDLATYEQKGVLRWRDQVYTL